MDEQWIVVDEFPNYEVSNTGMLRNKLTMKLIKLIINAGGYCQYGFRNISGEKPHTKCVHRYIAKAFIPNPLNLPQVNHIDGNKTNNHIDNLEWVTASRNKKHAYDIGLCERSKVACRNTINKINKGETNHNAKWTNEQIREIREKLANGIHVSVIMSDYNMSYSNVYKIKARTLWNHVH